MLLQAKIIFFFIVKKTVFKLAGIEFKTNFAKFELSKHQNSSF